MPSTPTFHRLTEPLAPDSEMIADLVRVWREAGEGHLRFLTALHSADEDRAYLSGAILPENEVWVAQAGGTPAGFIAFGHGWVNQLYVSPRAQGHGVGTALLAIAQRSNPTLHLWVFEANIPALRFYQRRGFRAVERTDGASNEAKRPDVRMRWDAPVDPDNL